MAKDPRFNFYPDNYMGGTMGFTLEQHGAYVQLIILNSKIGKFTEAQALDHLNTLTRGNTAVSTELWRFLITKFEREGQLFFSARLMKEMEKSKLHSQKQSERVKKRYFKKEDSTVVVPDNRTGIGNGSDTEEKGVQGETIKPTLKDYQEWIKQIETDTDLYWPKMAREKNLKLAKEQIQDLSTRYIGLLSEYPKKQPPDQHAFRLAFLAYCVENKPNNNGNNNKSSIQGSGTRKFSGKYEEHL